MCVAADISFVFNFLAIPTGPIIALLVSLSPQSPTLIPQLPPLTLLSPPFVHSTLPLSLLPQSPLFIRSPSPTVPSVYLLRVPSPSPTVPSPYLTSPPFSHSTLPLFHSPSLYPHLSQSPPHIPQSPPFIPSIIVPFPYPFSQFPPCTLSHNKKIRGAF